MILSKSSMTSEGEYHFQGPAKTSKALPVEPEVVVGQGPAIEQHLSSSGIVEAQHQAQQGAPQTSRERVPGTGAQLFSGRGPSWEEATKPLLLNGSQTAWKRLPIDRYFFKAHGGAMRHYMVCRPAKKKFMRGL